MNLVGKVELGDIFEKQLLNQSDYFNIKIMQQQINIFDNFTTHITTDNTY